MPFHRLAVSIIVTSDWLPDWWYLRVTADLVPLCRRRASLAPIRITPPRFPPTDVTAMMECRTRRWPSPLTVDLYHDPSGLYDPQIEFSGTTGSEGHVRYRHGPHRRRPGRAPRSGARRSLGGVIALGGAVTASSRRLRKNVSHVVPRPSKQPTGVRDSCRAGVAITNDLDDWFSQSPRHRHFL